MINVNEAYKIVLKENPKKEAATCTEREDKFVFSLCPKGCNVPVAGLAVYVVDKNTGEYKETVLWEVIKEPVIRQIDIATLLKEE